MMAAPPAGKPHRSRQGRASSRLCDGRTDDRRAQRRADRALRRAPHRRVQEIPQGQPPVRHLHHLLRQAEEEAQRRCGAARPEAHRPELRRRLAQAADRHRRVRDRPAGTRRLQHARRQSGGRQQRPDRDGRAGVPAWWFRHVPDQRPCGDGSRRAARPGQRARSRRRRLHRQRHQDRRPDARR